MSEGEKMSAEQGAELAALEAQAMGGAQGGAVAVVQSEAQAGPGVAALTDARMAVGFARPALGMMFKHLRTAPDEAWEPVVDGLAGLLEHYGVSGAVLFSNPWARAALGCAGLGIHVWNEMEKEAAAVGAAEKASPPAGAPAEPGSATVSFGTVAHAD